ncbi:MAG: DUF3179 domain-containing protein, partial [Rhodospirillales bacterium]|nr:DUF3179 domain-containing protein [Rhodospirillales bacterium]
MNKKLKFYITLITVTSLILIGMFVMLTPDKGHADSHPGDWEYEWPNTDFSRHEVAYTDIISGGPPKDGIPPIDDPQFISVEQSQKNSANTNALSDNEPVIGLIVNGMAKAYPLRILTWHEIINDKIGGVPVTITFCPLCNSSIVFDRRLDGKTLDFGTTGKLRNSDLVMYDRQTESWWQQFMGKAIIGEMTGTELIMIPSRMESWANFRKRAPNGQVLIPNDTYMRNYGRNPYVGYDTASMPFLYHGEMPEGINPMARVVAINDQAWALELLQERESISNGDIIVSWSAGQNSALDTGTISKGRDVGNILVQRLAENGEMIDVVHDVTFAFVFHA